jgi:hypothetical protein
MDLEETEARNDCVGEGQQEFNRPTVVSYVTAGVQLFWAVAVRSWQLWTRGHSEPRGNGNFRRWKSLPGNSNEDVTVDTSVCVCVRVCNSEL